MTIVIRLVFCSQCLLLLFTGRSSQAQVVVNEVMANEPGGYTTLEWIELFNDDNDTVSLAGYQLKIGDKSIELPDSLRLDTKEYFIVCRKLKSDTASPGFEGFWGDSSGVWGDTPDESSLQTPFEATFSLTNTSGSVELYDPTPALISELTWDESGQDGVSWERIDPFSVEINQSVDPHGSTPGFINSLTPVGSDLALEDVAVLPADGATIIRFTVANRGLNTVNDARLFLYYDDSENLKALSDTIDVVDVELIAPGLSTEIEREYFLDGIYVNLTASLTEDDRNRNNNLSFVAVGVDFPPVILSEVLANPEDPLETEWVEVKNRSGEPIDLADWQLGDSLGIVPVSDTTLLIEVGDYLIITQDSQAFLSFYNDFNGTCVQPSSWRALNNQTPDVVRLVDSFGFEADRFEYARTFADNYTWSRGEEMDHENDWGRSVDEGGTPGTPNAVVYEPTASAVAVEIKPTVFSPDGDGYEDVTIISPEAPAGAELTMKVYDRQGRVVRTLIDGESFLQDSYVWDGRSDAGHRLPIGIYILYAEAAGGESVKKPIVIAR